MFAVLLTCAGLAHSDLPDQVAPPARTQIRVSVLAQFGGAGGELLPAPADTRIIVSLADAPVSMTGPLHDLGPWSRKHERWPAVHRFDVPQGRALSVVAFSPSRGVAERVLRPADVASLAAALDSPLRLILPPPQAPATLQLAVEAESGRWTAPVFRILVRSPLADVVVAHTTPLEHPGGQAHIELPPGDYTITVDTHLDMCGNGPPSIRPSSGLRERIDLAPGERRSLRRLLDRGAPFALRVDVRSCENDVESSRRDALRWLDFATPDDAIGEHLWTATATIERVDAPGASAPVWFGWNECRYAFNRHHFPLGHTVYSTARYTPGRYRLTISSPRIETQSHEFTIDWSDSSWPSSSRAPVHIQVDARGASH